MTAPPAIISRTTAIAIVRRIRHRFLALELTACLASTDSGKAGNAAAGGGWPSIRFKALRMELKILILKIYNRSAGQERHVKSIFLSIENNFSQWSYKTVHRDTVLGLHLFDRPACPPVVLIIHGHIIKAQLI